MIPRRTDSASGQRPSTEQLRSRKQRTIRRYAAGDTYENAPLVNFVHRRARNRCAPPCARCAAGSAKGIHSSSTARRSRPASGWPRSIQARRTRSSARWQKREFPRRNGRSKRPARPSSDWCSHLSVEHRAELLERVAAIMDRRRFELSALEVYEVGKAWAEADGDIREAIDFLPFLRAANAPHAAVRDSPSTCPAKKATSITGRAASRSSSRPGISRWRF